MSSCACQGQKDTAPRKDSSVAVSLQDKDYLETFAQKNKKGSVKEALAEIIAAHRKGAAV